jgi:hypothetical protein
LLDFKDFKSLGVIAHVTQNCYSTDGQVVFIGHDREIDIYTLQGVQRQSLKLIDCEGNLETLLVSKHTLQIVRTNSLTRDEFSFIGLDNHCQRSSAV